MIGDRPLNPPILGDFPFIVPPKVGGLGGQNIPQISNALLISLIFTPNFLRFRIYHRNS